MPSTVWNDLDIILDHLHSEIDLSDFPETIIDVFACEKWLFLDSDLERILQEISIDVFGGLGHIHFFVVFC